MNGLEYYDNTIIFARPTLVETDEEEEEEDDGGDKGVQHQDIRSDNRNV